MHECTSRHVKCVNFEKCGHFSCLRLFCVCVFVTACMCMRALQECENISSWPLQSQYLFLHLLPLIFDYHVAVFQNPLTVE